MLNNKPIELTLLVRPELKSIEINTGTEYAYSGPSNSKVVKFQTNQSVIPVLTFTGLPFGNENKELIRMAVLA